MRFLTPWKKDDLSPMVSFQKEMNQLFNKFFEDFSAPSWFKSFEGVNGFNPSVDVKEDEKNVEVIAELPGMEEKDVEVTLTDGALTIKGEKKHEAEEKKENYHRVERSYGSFQRVIPLPEVENENVQASFKNGVLTVTLPKSKVLESKAKKIEIKNN
jgi:HSP20 family protein